MKKYLIAVASVLACASPATAQLSGLNRVLGAPNVVASQVAAQTTATLAAPQRDTRQDVTVAVGAANACAVGGPGVTLSTGFRLQPSVGASVVVRSRAALYVVCDAVTTVSVLDVF